MKEKATEAFFNDNYLRFSPETIRSYQIALKQFFSFIEVPYNQVKPAHIRSWLASLQEKELKPRSIQLKLAAIKSFYHYCMEENLVKKNPTLSIQTPRTQEEIPKFLSKKQLVQLQEITRQDIRDRVIIEILYATGVRVSELIHIRLEDIKWESRQIWIRKGKGNKERFVLFSYACLERINEYLKTRKETSEYLICNRKGGHVSRVFVEKKFNHYSELLGFHVTPHMLRHTFATHLAIKNMPQTYLQELLGHTNINSTHIYTKLSQDMRKKEYDKYQ